jgi:hypothetical protein
MNKFVIKATSTIFSLCIVCIILILQSCGSNSSFLKADDGKLSNEKAQRALDMLLFWM